ARHIKRETYALYLAGRDPRTPWYARVLAGLVIAYALSPIDLIPDFIPVLGYLDDLIIVPAGLLLVSRLIPSPVLADARARAHAKEDAPSSRTAAIVVIAVWLLVVAFAFIVVGRLIMDVL